MGSYFSTPEVPDDNMPPKPSIYIGKVSNPISSLIGFTYCLIYPPDDDGNPHVHPMDSGTMGQIYRSSWSHLNKYKLEFLKDPEYFRVYKSAVGGVRQERIRVIPFSETEREKMEVIMNSENDIEYF